MLDQTKMPWFAELNRGLRDALTVEQLQQRVEANARMLHCLAEQIATRVAAQDPRALLGLASLVGLESSAGPDLLREAA